MQFDEVRFRNYVISKMQASNKLHKFFIIDSLVIAYLNQQWRDFSSNLKRQGLTPLKLDYQDGCSFSFCVIDTNMIEDNLYSIGEVKIQS